MTDPQTIPEIKRPLLAFHNGYECVAARTEDEARQLVKTLGIYDDEDDLDGDGWKVLPPETEVKDEDGQHPTTMGALLAESPAPRHLYSCEV